MKAGTSMGRSRGGGGEWWACRRLAGNGGDEEGGEVVFRLPSKTCEGRIGAVEDAVEEEAAAARMSLALSGSRGGRRSYRGGGKPGRGMNAGGLIGT